MTTNRPRTTLDRWYEWFWRKLGSTKPITEHCRAFYHNYPLIIILFVGVAGYAMGHYLGVTEALVYAGWVFLGIVLGHFFWGAPHR